MLLGFVEMLGLWNIALFQDMTTVLSGLFKMSEAAAMLLIVYILIGGLCLFFAALAIIIISNLS